MKQLNYDSLCVQLLEIFPLILKGISIKFNVALALLANLFSPQYICCMREYLKNISFVLFLKPLAHISSNYVDFALEIDSPK